MPVITRKESNVLDRTYEGGQNKKTAIFRLGMTVVLNFVQGDLTCR